MKFTGSFSRSSRRGAAAFVILGSLHAQPAMAQTPVAPNAQGDIVLSPANAATRAGQWTVVSDSTAADGALIRHADAGTPKVVTPAVKPTNYFDLFFEAEAGKPYRLWVHGRAEQNHWSNDSVHVQFSRSVDADGAAVHRIGSTTSTEVILEDCEGCGLSDWTWQDNGYGSNALGPVIRFAASGTQQMRVQTREDGIAIDQVVLSPVTYLYEQPVETLDLVAGEVVLAAGAAQNRAGQWVSVADETAIGGLAIRHADAGGPKVRTALADPANYFELTFQAAAGIPYRLWIHGRAENKSWSNDSVFVQFSGSVTYSGSSAYRIGTTSATVVNLEDCRHCGIADWTWQDNGYGRDVQGPPVYFAESGLQTIRLQTREDGLVIDQILLSPAKYLTVKPTVTGPAPAPAPEPAPAPAPAPKPAPAPAPAPKPAPVPAPKPAPAPAPVPDTDDESDQDEEPEEDDEPAPTRSNTLKVLLWNIHHGVGTDGRYDIPRFVSWMAKWRPDVVSIIEAEKYTGWGNEDQPKRFRDLLQAATGQTWYYHFAQEYGNWDSNGKGNLLLSRFPFVATGRETLSWSRTMGIATIVVNGRNITVMSTHLDPESSSRRETQARQVVSLASTWTNPRIITGDFNAWPDQASVDVMTADYDDSWAEAQRSGDASSFAGNSPFGATKKGRIDYIFHSEASTVLRVKSVQVPDTRNSSGVMPSDHRPVLTVYEVR